MLLLILSPAIQSQAVEEHDTWRHAFSDIDLTVFTARRYASAVYDMVPCLCLFITSRCSTKTACHGGLQRQASQRDVNHV